MKSRAKASVWQWRAWDRSGKKIIARGSTLHDAIKAATAAGEPYPVLEQSTRTDTERPARLYWRRTA